MTRIAVLGGTGYAGTNFVKEAAGRGHAVTSLSRSLPAEPVAGVEYVQGSLGDAASVSAAIDGADAIIATLSPRGDNAGNLATAYQQLVADLAGSGKPIVFIGGFSSLRPAPDAPRFADGEVPEAFAAEVHELNGFREWLQTSAPADSDWIFVSPAGTFGSFAPGEALGHYRTSGEIAIFDENGESAISGADFALAVIDLVESGEHIGEHVSFAY